MLRLLDESEKGGVTEAILKPLSVFPEPGQVMFHPDQADQLGPLGAAERFAQSSCRNQSIGKGVGRQAEDIQIAPDPPVLKRVIKHQCRA